MKCFKLEQLRSAKRCIQINFSMTKQRGKVDGLNVTFPKGGIFESAKFTKKEMDWLRKNSAKYLEF